jgi:hypothetical protein
MLIKWNDPEPPTFLEKHPGIGRPAISADGRWIATGTFKGYGVKLWDGKTGKFVCELPENLYSAGPSFSLDGHWLATVQEDEYRFWEVGTWKPVLRIARNGGNCPAAFAPDGRTVAVGVTPYTLKLIDVLTGHEIATLRPPDRQDFDYTRFSPDGNYLAVSAAGVLQVWDLRAIRRRLAVLGLDWDPPATFNAADTPESVPPIPKPFRVDRGDLDSRLAQIRLNRLEAALADGEASLRLKPDQTELRTRLALLRNNLAWSLATGHASTRDPQRALSLARRAIELAPGQAIYLNTVGVAQYRAGRYGEAVATLEKSLAAGNGGSDAFDLFFLAMARFKLGQIAQARADFDRAVKWRRDHPNLTQPGWSDDLDAFQTEARALLDGPPAELPADVFAPD